MPSLVERRKATQRRALAKQRARIRRFTHQRKALARTRAAIRKARATIAKRKKLIEAAEGVRINGNTANGGTAKQRLKAVALAAVEAHAEGRRKSFYSQAGAWTVAYAITGEPRGYRSDCSQWVTSVFKSAGLGDPNGNDYKGGYTGTLANRGRQVSFEEAKRTPGALGFYGSYPFHHVEMSLGDGRWAGHGSPPVDTVTPGLPNHFRVYTN